jgi:hypothetical protein
MINPTLPFRLFDEIDAKMRELQSPYLGPDYLGRYVAAARGNEASFDRVYAFNQMVEHLRAAGFIEGYGVEDTAADFILAEIGFWVGSTEFLMISAEKTACLEVATEFQADKIDSFEIFECEDYDEARRNAAEQIWLEMLPEQRRDLSFSQLGKRYTKWSSVQAYQNQYGEGPEQLENYLLG